jgi:hypothetical protein
MRFLALVLVVALSPVPAFAQTSPPSAGASPGAAGAPPPGAISREQYIKQAADRAALRFDRMDVNHTGYLTREQMRDFRLAHHRTRQPRTAAPAAAPAPPPAKPQ